MPFKRVWDASCPREYDSWTADGVTYVIQDLRPEDDDDARHMLVEHLIPDETLCIASGMCNEELSLRSMSDFWKVCLSRRTSLACYKVEDDKRELVAVNCCVVVCRDEDDEICEVEGEAWQNVYNALHYAETRENIFDLLNLDTVLYAMGLTVRRDFRGAKLGARMLAARKPLSLPLGVKGTATVFTGIASQKSALRAGFTVAADVTFKELAENGLKYPNEDKSIQLMIKKFVD